MILVGAGSSPAFQRRSRATLKFILGVRLAETVSRHVGSKEMRVFLAFLSWNHIQNPCFLTVFALFAFLSRVGARALGILAFAPRSGPPRTHAPGAQMIWMESGSRLLHSQRTGWRKRADRT
eukprot:gene10864-biopygen9367